MTQSIALSGLDGRGHGDALKAALSRQRPSVVGVAAAFVSVAGVEQLQAILAKCGQPDCRLIAGTDNAVTHPEALAFAQERGWNVRLGRAKTGIFHPKLVVAGDRFSRDAGIHELNYVYVGSSNLTAGGLKRNVECGLATEGIGCPSSASGAFSDLWRASARCTKKELERYAARFAARARNRTPEDLADLGVTDSEDIPSDPADLRAKKPPVRPAVAVKYAMGAWAGLQSFTGEYRFQIEFPRIAGTVINELIKGRVGAGGLVDCYCTDDMTTRRMKYGFYAHNGMFRLNVPNDVPGVAWARAHRNGIAVVEAGPRGGAPLRLQLLRPGAEVRKIAGRSGSLGTWDKTSTRAYGWY